MSNSKQKTVDRYKLDSASTELWCRLLVQSRNKSQQRKTYGVFVLKGKDAISNVARSLEVQVFNEFFGNDEVVFAKEYGSYDKHSEFILVVDQKRLIPVGVARLIRHSERGLKTINDVTHELGPWKTSLKKILKTHKLALYNTIDIATIAVKRRYKNKRSRRIVRSLLFHAIYQHAVDAKATHWVALLDDMHVRTFKALGIPIVNLADTESRPYLGSSSTSPILVEVNMVSPSIKTKSRFNHLLLIRGRVLRSLASF